MFYLVIVLSVLFAGLRLFLCWSYLLYSFYLVEIEVTRRRVAVMATADSMCIGWLACLSDEV